MPLTYHYCSLETACAIISNASLRLCDITKSNDSAEITYGYAAAMDSLKRIGLISGSGPTLEFADHWIELLRPEYQTMLREALSRHLLPPNRLCYAVCLSERADQLSQWRAYGDDGRGVALGFDLSTFAQREPSFTVCSDDGHLLETHMMTLYRPIVYGRERSTECFDELAARMARNVHDLRAASARTPPLFYCQARADSRRLNRPTPRPHRGTPTQASSRIGWAAMVEATVPTQPIAAVKILVMEEIISAIIRNSFR